MAEKTRNNFPKSLLVLKVIFRWEIFFTGPAYFWDFLQHCVDTPALLLAPSCGGILKLVCLWFLEHVRLAIKRKPFFCFPKDGATGHVCGFSHDHSPGVFSEGTPCLLSPPHSQACTGSLLQNCGEVGV